MAGSGNFISPKYYPGGYGLLGLVVRVRQVEEKLFFLGFFIYERAHDL